LAFGHSLKHSHLTAIYGSQKKIIVSDRVADDDNSIMKQRWILKHFKESDTYMIEVSADLSIPLFLTTLI